MDSVLVTSAFMDVALMLPLSRAVEKYRSGAGDVCFRVDAAAAPQFGSKLSLPLENSFFLRRGKNFARCAILVNARDRCEMTESKH